MDETVRKINAEDINPRYNWGRALPALGTMGVDFEQRVDYRRLHHYRLARVRQALEKSDLFVDCINGKLVPNPEHPNSVVMPVR